MNFKVKLETGRCPQFMETGRCPQFIKKERGYMKIGVVLEDNQGLEGNVCAHFGQCKNFLIVDIAKDSSTIEKTQIVPNTIAHGSGGCGAVDEILKYNITHVIAGGMGGGAQQKFAQKGVLIFGYQGNVKEGIEALLKNNLKGIAPCQEHSDHGHQCH